MESAYKKHISKLENEILEKITPMALQDFCNRLELSLASKKAVFSWISQTYTYAEKMQIIDKNIVKLVEIRGYELEKNTKIFTKKEVEILKNRIKEASNLGYLFHLKGKDKPIVYETYRRKFGEILEKIGLEKHKTHDGRHTFITNAKRMRIDKTMLLQMVGHADEKTMDEVYTHFDINDLKSAMESFKIQ